MSIRSGKAAHFAEFGEDVRKKRIVRMLKTLCGLIHSQWARAPGLQ